MKTILKDNRDCTCYFCKSEKSVKYIAKKRRTNEWISVCNMCAVVHNDKLEDLRYGN